MADCECITKCPFFNGQMAVQLSSVVDAMKRRLCQGDNAGCARYMIFSRLGKAAVPDDLIPNQVDRAKKIIAAA